MKEVPTKQAGDELSADEYSLCTSQECQNVILNTGQTLSQSNLDQLSQAITRMGNGATAYKDVTGAVSNAYVISPDTQFINSDIDVYFAGMTLILAVENANTGPVTLNVNGLGATPLLDVTGGALVGGELVPGVTNYIKYVGTNFILFPFNASDLAFQQALASEVNPTGATLVGTNGLGASETVQAALGRLNANTGAGLIGTQMPGASIENRLPKAQFITNSSASNPISYTDIYNMGSVVKGTSDGLYTCTFTNPLASADYNILVTSKKIQTTYHITAQTQNSFTLQFNSASSGTADNSEFSCTVI